MKEQPDQAATVGSVRVTRDAAGPRDKWRAYRILVDGAPVATIRRGKSVSVDLPPGPHAVQLKIDWCMSPEVAVDVVAGAELRLECGARHSEAGNLALITAERDNYLWLRPAGEPGA